MTSAAVHEILNATQMLYYDQSALLGGHQGGQAFFKGGRCHPVPPSRHAPDHVRAPDVMSCPEEASASELSPGGLPVPVGCPVPVLFLSV